MTITLHNPAVDRKPSTEDLVHAIELACSPVLGSLSMANALGGRQTDAWCLVREHSLAALIDEAVDRGVDLSTVKAACCDVLVSDTPPFRAAVGYDPRPKCGLCNRRHYRDRKFIDERRGGVPELSCGDRANRYETQPKTWTRQTAMAAVEGTYEP